MRFHLTMHLIHFCSCAIFYFILVIIIIFASCSGTPKRPGSGEPAPTPTPTPQQEQPVGAGEIEPTPAPTPTPEPVSKVNLGWILSRSDRAAIQQFTERASYYNIDQIHLTGEFLHTIDELIYDFDKQEIVQTIAENLEQQGIDLYLWSHELNLPNNTFMFMQSDPLVAARKAAYNNVLKQIPEIDGVVLVMEGAPVAPWDAVIPPLHPQRSNSERIQFVIEMIRDTVEFDQGKDFCVKTSQWNSEHNQWIAQALEGIPPEQSKILSSADYPQEAILSLSQYTHLAEINLAAEPFGGPKFLYSKIGDIRSMNEDIQNERFGGSIAWVQSKYGNPFQNPNQINLGAFSKLKDEETGLGPTIWDEWLQNQYSIDWRSREGVSLQHIYKDSSDWGSRIYFANGVIPITRNGGVPESMEQVQTILDSFPRDHPRYARIKRELAAENKQFLVDLAQESFEAQEWIQDAMDELNNLKSILASQTFNEFYDPMRHQLRVARVFHYLKQCIWGFEYWKQTRDPYEALHLEAHLRRLRELSLQMEEEFGPTVEPGNPEMILSFIESVRSQFPRVIFGQREREWNRLRDIIIRQTGASRVEVSWTSDEPSLSKIFITQSLPSYNRFEEISTNYSNQHRSVIDGMEPGQTYYFKIQCENENGQITNSGDYRVYFEMEPMM